MILPGGRIQVFVASRPVGFRKGMDSLAAVVQERLRLNRFSGAVFVFRAKRGRVKLLVRDGSGLTLIYMRLDEARFVWPRIEGGDAAVAGPVGRAVRGARRAPTSRPSGWSAGRPMAGRR